MVGDGSTNCSGPTSRCVSTETTSEKNLIVDNFFLHQRAQAIRQCVKGNRLGVFFKEKKTVGRKYDI